jgi:hypothetical protein
MRDVETLRPHGDLIGSHRSREQSLQAEIDRLKRAHAAAIEQLEDTQTAHGIVVRDSFRQEAAIRAKDTAIAWLKDMIVSNADSASAAVRKHEAKGYAKGKAEGLREGFMAGIRAQWNEVIGWSFGRNIYKHEDEPQAYAAYLASRTPTQGQEGQ